MGLFNFFGKRNLEIKSNPSEIINKESLFNLSIPTEYIELCKKIDFENRKVFFYLYNFGSFELYPIVKEEIAIEHIFPDNKYQYKGFPFAYADEGSILAYTYGQNSEYLGIYFISLGFPYHYKNPIKISNSLSDMFNGEEIQNQLLNINDIVAYEETVYQSYSLFEKGFKGVIPLNTDLRIEFSKQFPKSVVIDKETDYKKAVEKFLIENNLNFNDLPEGRYYSHDFDKLFLSLREINQEPKLHYCQFIPSDFYALGLYSDEEVAKLMKYGLVRDKYNIISEESYNLLK